MSFYAWMRPIRLTLIAVCVLAAVSDGWSQNQNQKKPQQQQHQQQQPQKPAPQQHAAPAPHVNQPAPAAKAQQPAPAPKPAKQNPAPAPVPAAKPNAPQLPVQQTKPTPQATPAAPAPAVRQQNMPPVQQQHPQEPTKPVNPNVVRAPNAPTPAVTQHQPMHPAYTPPASNHVASRTPTGASVLNQEGSHKVLADVNASRAGLHGINARPIPHGEVTMHPDGRLTVATEHGSHYAVRPNGTVATIEAHGREAHFRPDGRVAEIHTPTMEIHRGLRGEAVVRTMRPDHTVLVSTGPHHGYLERSVVMRDQHIIQRTYVAEGRVFSRAFVGYPFRGATLPMYVPAAYFAPAFYGWAFYPWATPITYAWGWRSDPWFAAFGGYYQPAPVYASPGVWLTDYTLSRTLADAYAAQTAPPTQTAQAGPPPEGELYAPADTPISPALHNAIAEEVSRQLAYENAIASNQAKPEVAQLSNALKPGRIFLVAMPMQTPTTDGQTCELTGADVLQLNEVPPPDAATAVLRVVSSKRMDCPAGVDVAVGMADLAEMQNNLRTMIDDGLGVLHTNQGKGGLPAAPVAAVQAPVKPAFDVPLPPDPNVQNMLNAQQQEAVTAEQATLNDITADVPLPPNPTTPTTTP